MKELSPRQRIFVSEYLKFRQGHKAAIAAGYSKKSADAIASRMLTFPPIAKAIEEGLRKLEDKSIMSAREVLQELSRLGRSDIRKLYRDDGSLKAVRAWSDDMASTVASVEADEIFEGLGRERKRIGVTRKVKLWDKPRALQDLARYHKLLIEKIELDVSESLAERLERARKRVGKDGL